MLHLHGLLASVLDRLEWSWCAEKSLRILLCYSLRVQVISEKKARITRPSSLAKLPGKCFTPQAPALLAYV